MNSLDWLMQWYADQCDGDWEHGHGIEIGTLDNPGWQLTIHTIGTRWEGLKMEEIRHKYDDEAEWFTCKANGMAFTGFGGPKQLGAMIEVFAIGPNKRSRSSPIITRTAIRTNSRLHQSYFAGVLASRSISMA